MTDPIENYLDDLLGYLRGTPREVREMLSESEAHLRSLADHTPPKVRHRWTPPTRP
jgi:hypothetical protein